MRGLLTSWQVWALGSAVFAALTAIFAKIGITEVNSDFATFIRTIVILGVTAALLAVTGNWQAPGTVPARTYVFLLLSGIATGASWLCYFRALQKGPASVVVPIDKTSIVVTVAFAWLFLGERLTRRGVLGLLLIVAGTLLMLV